MNYGGAPPAQPRTNVLTVVGFWLALGGLLTCGITGIPALICSALGMRQEPKGWAIAGLFVSLPSVLWCLFWIGTWVLGVAAHLAASGATR